MNSSRTRRWLWILWIAMLAILVQMVRFPVSTEWTRGGNAFLVALLWVSLLALCWRRRVLRAFLLTVTFLAAVFLATPGRARPPVAELRAEYVAGLERYEGVTYDWGGESPRGIDCSGLVRRGLIDARFLRGLRTLDPGPVRGSIALWWNDCTAKALGEGYNDTTTHVLDTPGLNELDHAPLLPGDLAVTKSGTHILAYIGDRTWIEADPMAGKVIRVQAPSKTNAWFQGPMKIVRWKVLAP